MKMTTRVNKLHQNSKFEQLIKCILFGQTSVISHHNSILDVGIFKLCKNRLMPLMQFLKENVITTLIPLRPEERNSEKSNKNNKTDTRKIWVILLLLMLLLLFLSQGLIAAT